MTGILQRLIELSLRRRLPHGMLWVGPDLEAKKSSVRQLTRFLFCGNRKNSQPCGTCLSCQKVERGHHPDLFFVHTESKEVRIEQVRELARWLNIGPNEASQKIGVVEEADLLNASSSNALLKTLEEPPLHALIVLLARSSANILPTVRSRLMLIRFPAGVDDSQMESDCPAWGEELEHLLKAPGAVSPDQLFDLTEVIAKDKDRLPWFFWLTQKTLRHRIQEAREAGIPGLSRKLESLFDLSVQTERVVLRRYGNVALGLDRLLSEWLL